MSGLRNPIFLSSGGLASEQDYPFKRDFKPQKCQAQDHEKVAWIQDFTMVPRNEHSTCVQI